ncbi:staphylokinase domain-containing protein [Staphylococcus xylosus]|uniref:staphylokinase domain-containing protein n=1 Tax=Staphylococcus xylosus TaxID=1288 RepID=UPI000D1DE11E|nr:staphylokinase domain-containing protein [Staphylococcus xylosus]PTI14717.1 kinase [Staphylococcus xylosus]RIM84709.1 kinase [Staphylococcus xylosus]
MKNYKKVIIVSLVASGLAFTPLVNTQANASSDNQSSFRIGEDREYQEINGPHLIYNITGIDKNGKEILYPSFMEFHIKPGQVLNKKDLTRYAEWTLDNAVYNKYRVVDFAPDSKVQVTYFSKTEKQYVTEYFPITDKGFVVPDLSEHTSNPGFTLVTNVVIEEKKPK